MENRYLGGKGGAAEVTPRHRHEVIEPPIEPPKGFRPYNPPPRPSKVPDSHGSAEPPRDNSTTEWTSEAKRSSWILKGMPDEQRAMIINFIHDSNKNNRSHIHAGNHEIYVPLDGMITPFPLAMIMAERMKQILSAMGIVNTKIPTSGFTFMDPMGGSGADALAVTIRFKKQVLAYTGDIDPVKVHFMQKLLTAYNDGSWENEEKRNEMIKERHKMSLVTSTRIDKDLDKIPNIDVLYLDPPWPYDINQPYMIGETDLVDFVPEAFKTIPTLRLVIVKVSSDYKKTPIIDGKAGKSTLNRLVEFCKDNGVYMEEFFPMGARYVKDKHTGGEWTELLPTPSTVYYRGIKNWKNLKGGLGYLDVEAWNNAYNAAIAKGFDKYPGTCNFLFMAKYVKFHNQVSPEKPDSDYDDESDNDDNFKAAIDTTQSTIPLDVSIFL